MQHKIEKLIDLHRMNHVFLTDLKNDLKGKKDTSSQVPLSLELRFHARKCHICCKEDYVKVFLVIVF